MQEEIILDYQNNVRRTTMG